jgi:uncharacterized membrane protein
MSTFAIITVFAVIGILDTAYLIYHKIRGTDVACIGFPKEWCRKVQYSRQSSTFGIPNSVAGFVMYALIFFLVALQAPGAALWPLQFLVLFGFLFSLYFMYVQAFVLRAFCTWCVLSFINFTVMAWALFIR